MDTNKKMDLQPTAAQLNNMSHADLKVLIKRLQCERTILRSMSAALLHLCFANINDNQWAGLSNLTKIQAEMVGLELPRE